MPRLPRVAKPIVDAEPQLDALVGAVRFPHTRDFEWLAAYRLTDGTRIDVFVHFWTGRVLRLGEDGASFGLTPAGRYKERDLEPDVESAIPWPWEWLEMGGYSRFDVAPEPWLDEEWDPWEGYDIDLAA